jgi:hypothetical protein
MPSSRTITINADEAEYYRLERLLGADPRDLNQERVEALAAGLVLGEVYHTSADAEDGDVQNPEMPPSA